MAGPARWHAARTETLRVAAAKHHRENFGDFEAASRALHEVPIWDFCSHFRHPQLAVVSGKVTEIEGPREKKGTPWDPGETATA